MSFIDRNRQIQYPWASFFREKRIKVQPISNLYLKNGVKPKGKETIRNRQLSLSCSLSSFTCTKRNQNPFPASTLFLFFTTENQTAFPLLLSFFLFCSFRSSRPSLSPGKLITLFFFPFFFFYRLPTVKKKSFFSSLPSSLLFADPLKFLEMAFYSPSMKHVDCHGQGTSSISWSKSWLWELERAVMACQ